MSYQGSYELMVGNPAAFQSIQGNMLKSLYCGQQQPASQPLLFPGYHALQSQLQGQGLLSHHAQPIQPPLLHPAPTLPTTSLAPTAIASSLSQPSAQAAPQSKKFRPPQKSQRYIPKPIPLELGNLKTYSNPDILICGNCRELFNDLVDMLEHKKNYCKMRFTCRCEQKEEGEEVVPQKAITDASNAGCDPPPSSGKRVCLRCSQCKETFTGAWDLMFHAQNAHCINIYTLGEKDKALQQSPPLLESSCEISAEEKSKRLNSNSNTVVNPSSNTMLSNSTLSSNSLLGSATLSSTKQLSPNLSSSAYSYVNVNSSQ